jgi:hypothetical protein
VDGLTDEEGLLEALGEVLGDSLGLLEVEGLRLVEGEGL